MRGLDDVQHAAAAHAGGPLVVLAGAGTGKTRTLTARVAQLLARGADPSRVLLLTFTRRAGADMLARAAVLCGDRRVAGRLWGGTFHAVAHRLVSQHAEALGLPAALSVLDQADASDLMDLLRHDHGLAGTGERFPRADTLVDAYSRAVNTGRAAREVIAAEFPWCDRRTDKILGLFRAYTARKRAGGLLDFDDLLLVWRSLLTDPTLGPTVAGRWDHVLVDEYQDVNQVQVDIVRLLRPGEVGLTVVGDDAQAIYGFRGADAGHLTDLATSLPDVTVVRLERNFRSRQPLLDLANAVRPSTGQLGLRLYSDRPDGPRPRLVRCYDAPAEARLVADAVLEAVEAGRRLRDQAVLMRAGHHSDLLEVELTARRVPFVKFGGLKSWKPRTSKTSSPGCGCWTTRPMRSPGTGCCASTMESVRPAPASCSPSCNPATVRRTTGTATPSRQHPPPLASDSVRPSPDSPRPGMSRPPPIAPAPCWRCCGRC